MMTTPRIGFVYYHGWAQTPEFFSPLKEALSQYPWCGSHRFYDGGYFSKGESWPLCPSDERWIGIGHGLGFAKLWQARPCCASLISLSGFRAFCSSEGSETGMNPEWVDWLMVSLEREPLSVLRAFYQRCGMIKPPSMSDLNLQRLRDDLHFLKKINLHAESWPDAPPITVLWGQKDSIVPEPSMRTLHQDFQIQHLWVHPEADHGLGHNHIAWCVHRILDVVQNLQH